MELKNDTTVFHFNLTMYVNFGSYRYFMQLQYASSCLQLLSLLMLF